MTLQKKGQFWVCHYTAADGEAPFMEIWGVQNTPFIAIPTMSTLPRSGSTFEDSSCGSNRPVWNFEKYYTKNVNMDVQWT